MNHLIFVPIALWTWLVLAVVTSATIGFFVGYLIKENDKDWGSDSLVLIALVAASGFLFSALTLLGHPLLALWSWRILCGWATVAGLTNVARLSSHFRAEALDWFATLGAAILAIGLFACSVLAAAPHSESAGVFAGSAQNAVEPMLRIDFWHAASLGVLGCGTLLFGLLFIGAIQRHGLLWFESSSGGLGGGVSGWRISSSIGYLAAAVLFGGMFSALVVHDENLSKASIAATGSSAAATAGPSATQAAVPKNDTPTDAKPDAGKMDAKADSKSKQSSAAAVPPGSTPAGK